MGTQAGCWPELDVAAAPYELVALGGDLEPDTLLAAYRAGCFPWPAADPAEASLLAGRARRLLRRRLVHRLPGPSADLPWFSPDPRAVFLPDRVHVARTLRRTLRRAGWTSTVDVAFAEVVAGCADRPSTWITAAMAEAYGALHAAGHAHSVEVWSAAGELVGGLYGVQTGAVFSGESMFHRVPDAGRAALVDLAARARAGGLVLIDSQQPTEHHRRMGQLVVRRADYLALLATVRDRPVRLAAGPAELARLAEPVTSATG